MTLRTPNPYRSYQSLLDFQRSKERLSVLSEQMIKDKRITRLSDDPTGAALIMDFENSIERNKMYVKQGESASSFLTGTEAALSSIDIQIDRLLELGEEGLSDLTASRGREAISAEVDVIRTVLLDLSNTKEQGKYIFAGTQTTTMPFTFNPGPFTWTVPNAPPVPDAVSYAGNLGNIDLDISPTASVTSNLSGELVFQGSRDASNNLDPDQDLFIAVTQLRDGLASNDRALIDQAFNNIREIKNRINVCLTTVGSRHVQLENSATNLGDFNEALQSIQNTYEAPDYPWVITQFAAEQSSQQAALAVLSKMGKYSLFDYIG
jgi:flagellar hook-associated protein 3 FlgL